MNCSVSGQPLVAFALPGNSQVIGNRVQYPRRCSLAHSYKMRLSEDSDTSTSAQPSRRIFLLSSAISAIFSLSPAQRAIAYSSPYKPGQKQEQVLPDRLYEDAVQRVVTTKSGLQYFDLLPGTGEEAKQGSTVSIYYTSRLRGLYGIKITSTYDDPSAAPLVLQIGSSKVVPGVSEALTGMKVGGKRRAVLPPNIAYKSANMIPAVTEFFAKRRLMSVLETNRDATIVFE